MPANGMVRLCPAPPAIQIADVSCGLKSAAPQLPLYIVNDQARTALQYVAKGQEETSGQRLLRLANG